jgi:hypothetical protein
MITSIIAANRHERRIITAASVAVLAFSSIAHAQEGGGTVDEAKAMLWKAAAAVKEDEAKAVETFNKGEGGFLDRDLYVFCGDLKTGKINVSANPNGEVVIGKNVKDIKDYTGKQFGNELWYAMNTPRAPRSSTCGLDLEATRLQFRRSL